MDAPPDFMSVLAALEAEMPAAAARRYTHILQRLLASDINDMTQLVDIHLMLTALYMDGSLPSNAAELVYSFIWHLEPSEELPPSLNHAMLETLLASLILQSVIGSEHEQKEAADRFDSWTIFIGRGCRNQVAAIRVLDTIAYLAEHQDQEPYPSAIHRLCFFLDHDCLSEASTEEKMAGVLRLFDIYKSSGNSYLTMFIGESIWNLLDPQEYEEIWQRISESDPSGKFADKLRDELIYQDILKVS